MIINLVTQQGSISMQQGFTGKNQNFTFLPGTPVSAPFKLIFI